MASSRVLACALIFSSLAVLLLLVGAAKDNEVTTVINPSEYTEITSRILEKSEDGLGSEYCCLKDGLNNCVQSCDSTKQYYCCLKNGLGSCVEVCEAGKKQYCCLKNGVGSCIQLCEEGKEHYCCQKNVFGSCTKICPKKSMIARAV